MANERPRVTRFSQFVTIFGRICMKSGDKLTKSGHSTSSRTQEMSVVGAGVVSVLVRVVVVLQSDQILYTNSTRSGNKISTLSLYKLGTMAGGGPPGKFPMT